MWLHFSYVWLIKPFFLLYILFTYFFRMFNMHFSCGRNLICIALWHYFCRWNGLTLFQQMELSSWHISALKLVYFSTYTYKISTSYNHKCHIWIFQYISNDSHFWPYLEHNLLKSEHIYGIILIRLYIWLCQMCDSWGKKCTFNLW
jgi:hypothetical protein